MMTVVGQLLRLYFPAMLTRPCPHPLRTTTGHCEDCGVYVQIIDTKSHEEEA